jgi:hypothetical protein
VHRHVVLTSSRNSISWDKVLGSSLAALRLCDFALK